MHIYTYTYDTCKYIQIHAYMHSSKSQSGGHLDTGIVSDTGINMQIHTYTYWYRHVWTLPNIHARINIIYTYPYICIYTPFSKATHVFSVATGDCYIDCYIVKSNNWLEQMLATLFELLAILATNLVNVASISNIRTFCNLTLEQKWSFSSPFSFIKRFGLVSGKTHLIQYFISLRL